MTDAAAERAPREATPPGGTQPPIAPDTGYRHRQGAA